MRHNAKKLEEQVPHISNREAGAMRSPIVNGVPYVLWHPYSIDVVSELFFSPISNCNSSCYFSTFLEVLFYDGSISIWGATRYLSITPCFLWEIQSLPPNPLRLPIDIQLQQGSRNLLA